MDVYLGLYYGYYQEKCYAQILLIWYTFSKGLFFISFSGHCQENGSYSCQYIWLILCRHRMVEVFSTQVLAFQLVLGDIFSHDLYWQIIYMYIQQTLVVEVLLDKRLCFPLQSAHGVILLVFSHVDLYWYIYQIIGGPFLSTKGLCFTFQLAHGVILLVLVMLTFIFVCGSYTRTLEVLIPQKALWFFFQSAHNVIFLVLVMLTYMCMRYIYIYILGSWKPPFFYKRLYVLISSQLRKLWYQFSQVVIYLYITFRLDSQKALFYKRRYILLVFSHVGIYLYRVDILDHWKSFTQKAFCLSYSFLLELFYQFYFIYYMLHSLVGAPFIKRGLCYFNERILCVIFYSLLEVFSNNGFWQAYSPVSSWSYISRGIYLCIFIIACSTLSYLVLLAQPVFSCVYVICIYIYIYTRSRRVISHRKALYLI